MICDETSTSSDVVYTLLYILTVFTLQTKRNQIANAIDIFVHLKRDARGRRRVEEVAELTGFDGNEYTINYLYRVGTDGVLAPTGRSLCDRERLIRGGFGNRLCKDSRSDEGRAS